MKRVCRLDALAKRTSKRFTVDGRPVLLCRDGSALHAMDDTCPHEDVSLSLGAFDGETVRCPLHGSRFCVKSGRVLDPPADHDLATHAVHVDDGWVVITLATPAARPV